MDGIKIDVRGKFKDSKYLPSFKNILTLINPPHFLLNCDVINIPEHNLHMIIVFVFLFVSK